MVMMMVFRMVYLVFGMICLVFVRNGELGIRDDVSDTYLERVMNSVFGMMYLVFEGMLACMQKPKRC